MILSLMEHVGGSGTWLPRPVEAALGWSICVSCLSVSGYHWCRATLMAPLLSYLRNHALLSFNKMITGGGRAIAAAADKNEQDNSGPFFQNPYIPLTTSSRSEQDSASATQRYNQLITVLNHHLCDDNNEQPVGAKTWQNLSYEKFVAIFRCNDPCRRLASLLMRQFHQTLGNTTTLTGNLPDLLELLRRLARLWPQLLELPPLGSYVNGDFDELGAKKEGNGNRLGKGPTTVEPKDPFPFRISVVLPAFGENGTELSAKLERAYMRCDRPLEVEIVVVDAGSCTNMEQVALEHQFESRTECKSVDTSSQLSNASESKWGRAILLNFREGGGRGPCLNYGARFANGQFLCFLHSDTTLPHRWDCKLVEALSSVDAKGRTSNSCAFSFGIDTSPAGLNDGTCPPGIKAVEVTANLRTHLYALPYGDQCLSVPHTIFRFLGGFPDQCLMEDYELISLLRQRAAMIHKFDSRLLFGERLTIIGGEPALCSPRRWQKFGVPRVTALNSKFVNLYSSGMTPDNLFRKYYGGDPPRRESERAPWEDACLGQSMR
jgi:hypothetical protein